MSKSRRRTRSVHDHPVDRNGIRVLDHLGKKPEATASRERPREDETLWSRVVRHVDALRARFSASVHDAIRRVRRAADAA